MYKPLYVYNYIYISVRHNILALFHVHIDCMFSSVTVCNVVVIVDYCQTIGNLHWCDDAYVINTVLVYTKLYILCETSPNVFSHVFIMPLLKLNLASIVLVS